MLSDYYIPLLHKGKVVPTVAGSIGYTTAIADLASAFSEGFVPAGYEHRPDLISNLFLDGPSSWWAMLAVNSIVDPFEGLKLNDRIMIPHE